MDNYVNGMVALRDFEFCITMVAICGDMIALGQGQGDLFVYQGIY